MRHPVQPQDEVVLTPSMAIRIPRVVALKDFDRLPRQDVKFSRHNIYLRDGNRCQYCGHKFSSSELSLDHVIPLSRGGSSTWENVVCACLSCNVRKGNRTPHEASMRLIAPPAQAALASGRAVRLEQVPSRVEELPGRGVLEYRAEVSVRSQSERKQYRSVPCRDPASNCRFYGSLLLDSSSSSHALSAIST